MDANETSTHVQKLRVTLSQWLGAVAPSPLFWRGARWGLSLLILWLYALTLYAMVGMPSPSLGSSLAALKVTAQILLAGVALLLVIRVVARIPACYAWVLFCSLVFLAIPFGGSFKPLGLIWTLVAAVLPVSIFGGSVALLMGRRTLTSPLRRSLAIVGALMGAAALLYFLAYFFRDGFEHEAPKNAAVLSQADIPTIRLPDPSKKGTYTVKELHYGSGVDRKRKEFGEDVDLVTQSVDGTPFIDGWEKRSGWARTAYWGFDVDELPLQGRVWYPQGDGPFPLVLVVHGNHAMEDFSDPGYAYLGRLLASRGIILVSVDENFVNSSFSAVLDGLDGRGLKAENDARGWLLLEHLRQFRDWNATAGHPFHDVVDMERIGLIGHSRGGEAVAIAASFNRLPYYPDDATIAFDYRFSIKGIVAIAPVDGQYKPTGLGTTFTDVDYFVLHGSHDGDVQSFGGSRQFERVGFSGEAFHFKSSLYVYGANHGQFNSTWGRADSYFPSKNMLNLEPIIPPEEQIRIAEVYISAFFEVCLKGHRGYLPLFQDFRRGAHWLPDTIYLAHYEDSTHRIVSNFDEDMNVTSTTLDGGAGSGENLTIWREELVSLKRRDKGTNAVFLGWNRDVEPETASYTIELPEEGLDVTERSALVFTLADANEDSDPKKGEEEEDNEAEDEGIEGDDDATREGIDLSIEIVDRNGVAARRYLSGFSLIQPQLVVQVRKADMFNKTKTSEAVFQSFSFPLADFVAANPELDVAQLAQIRFVFDRTDEGVVILDNVGFRPDPYDNK